LAEWRAAIFLRGFFTDIVGKIPLILLLIVAPQRIKPIFLIKQQANLPTISTFLFYLATLSASFF